MASREKLGFAERSTGRLKHILFFLVATRVRSPKRWKGGRKMLSQSFPNVLFISFLCALLFFLTAPLSFLSALVISFLSALIIISSLSALLISFIITFLISFLKLSSSASSSIPSSTPSSTPSSFSSSKGNSLVPASRAISGVLPPPIKETTTLSLWLGRR